MVKYSDFQKNTFQEIRFKKLSVESIVDLFWEKKNNIRRFLSDLRKRVKEHLTLLWTY